MSLFDYYYYFIFLSINKTTEIPYKKLSPSNMVFVTKQLGVIRKFARVLVYCIYLFNLFKQTKITMQCIQDWEMRIQTFSSQDNINYIVYCHMYGMKKVPDHLHMFNFNKPQHQITVIQNKVKPIKKSVCICPPS